MKERSEREERGERGNSASDRRHRTEEESQRPTPPSANHQADWRALGSNAPSWCGPTGLQWMSRAHHTAQLRCNWDFYACGLEKLQMTVFAHKGKRGQPFTLRILRTFSIPTHESKLNYSWVTLHSWPAQEQICNLRPRNRTLKFGCQEIVMRSRSEESFLPLYLSEGRMGLKQ